MRNTSSELAPVPVKNSETKIGLTCKRVTDVVLAGSALVALSPIMLVTAALIKIDSPGPIIFKQKRFGRHGEYFEIYKFRSMRCDTPDIPTDQMLKMPSPVTRLGKFIRATSIDELPQLINVLRGDMTIVGPRPALHNQVSLNEKRQDAGVLRFPPGITGWAQVNGRDELADDEKVSFDKWYCDNWNYWLDWRIIALTVSTVLTGRGGN